MGSLANITNTAGTTTGKVFEGGMGEIKRVVLSWTSSGAAAVTATLPFLSGVLARVTFNPGTPAPDANYDVTLTDEDGFDVLCALGANRHTTNTESLIPFMGNGTVTDREVTICGPLTLGITNAGNAKQGQVILYLRR